MSHPQDTRDRYARGVAIVANIHALVEGTVNALRRSDLFNQSVEGERMRGAILSQLVHQRILKNLKAQGV